MEVLPIHPLWSTSNHRIKVFSHPVYQIAQLSAIPSPAEGLMVYNTDEKYLICFDGSNWKKMDGTLFWTCGLSFTVNHVAGNVAPVNKTITYRTVTN
jgi:hypothetical protein